MNVKGPFRSFQLACPVSITGGALKTEVAASLPSLLVSEFDLYRDEAAAIAMATETEIHLDAPVFSSSAAATSVTVFVGVDPAAKPGALSREPRRRAPRPACAARPVTAFPSDLCAPSDSPALPPSLSRPPSLFRRPQTEQRRGCVRWSRTSLRLA